MQNIRSTGITAGIALNPETPLDNITDVLDTIDLVVIMSVHPGFGGQLFIESVLPKIEKLRTMKPGMIIQIDGGIDRITAKRAIAAGANNLVAGSSIFKESDRSKAIRELRGEVGG